MTVAPATNPFLRYRTRLDSYASARRHGWSDDEFVSLVTRLDNAVAAVAGSGFRVTPAVGADRLAMTLGIDATLHVKDETGNVGGSHKSRHLFGVLLHLAVTPVAGGELAIASCGNAAVAAAMVAKAVDRPLRVFIPMWADPAVVTILEGLDAHIEVSERRPGESGDPTFLRFTEAVERGAVPFSVQGTSTPTAIDGGRTIGWELAEQLAPGAGRVRLFVQVGGGALASAVWSGLHELRPSDRVVLHAVQTEACAPLERAWRLLTEDLAGAAAEPVSDDAPIRALELEGSGAEAMDMAATHPERYMWPWEPVGTSSASGILDDITYDWRTVVVPMIEGGGWPVVVPERLVAEANLVGRDMTGIDVDPTGTAGLAAMLDPATTVTIDAEDQVVVLFTGVRRP